MTTRKNVRLPEISSEINISIAQCESRIEQRLLRESSSPIAFFDSLCRSSV